MSHLAKKPERESVAEEMEEGKCELFKSTEARLRDLQHLEMAYEWLRNRRNRREPAQSKRAIENV